MRFVLLPGMDGTGELFSSFIEELGSFIEPQVVRYPHNIEQSVVGLADYVESVVPRIEPYVLLGESFSGPIAFEVVRRRRTNVQKVIFVATFLQPPRPLLLSLRKIVPIQFVARRRIPTWVLDNFLLGENVDSQAQQQFREVVCNIPPATLAQRLHVIAKLSQPIDQVDCPSLYIQANQDILVPKRSIKDFEKHCRCLTTTKVEGKHFVLQSSPMECAAEVMRYLEDKL